MKQLKIMLPVLLLASVNTATAQLSPANTPSTGVTPYIESARVVIDILQLFKRNPAARGSISEKSKGSTCNFCLFNSDSTQKIKVTLTTKNTTPEETMMLVIKPKDKECSLQIKCGVYNCKIETLDNTIISWGDILINEKDILISR
jgi:hypothetical protein